MVSYPVVVVEEILCRFVGFVGKHDARTFGRRRGIELMRLNHRHMANSVIHSVARCCIAV